MGPIRTSAILLVLILSPAWCMAGEKHVKKAKPETKVKAAPAEREPCTIVKVIDGDTVDVKLENGDVERTRLLSIDTEESYTSTFKPATPFGKETSAWAKRYITVGEPCEVEYGPERRDVYKRLLVYLHYDGENYNLKTVRDGWSPYFMKYGYSEKYHDAMTKAEAEARKAGKGLWDRSRSSDLRGDYDKLLAWWGRRAEALKTFDTSFARRGDIYAPRRGDYNVMKERLGSGGSITVFTAIRTAKEDGSVYAGASEGKLYEPLNIVALLSNTDTVAALKDVVGEYRYFSGSLVEGVDGKPRLVISSPAGISSNPPAKKKAKKTH